MSSFNWPLYEVFVRSKQGLDHKHVGSVRASDGQMALEAARDLYTRRSEGCSIWVVESNQITASQSSEQGPFLTLLKIKFIATLVITPFLLTSSICRE